jgi:pyrophosphatase PpaX
VRAGVLLDLDGTLLDTEPLILASFRAALGPDLDVERDVLPFFGEPLRASLQRLAPRRVEQCVERYRTFNLAHHDEMVRPFPGARPALERLRALGIACGVVTNKLRETAERGLRVCGLDDLVAAVVGVRDTPAPKPDAAPVRLACERIGVAAADAAMVGDTPTDIAAGLAAGAWPVGVAWSLYPPARLRAAGAAAILPGLADLPALMRVRMAARAGDSQRIAEVVGEESGRRWVGVYRVGDGEVVNLAWSGPGAPAEPFQGGLRHPCLRKPADRGLTGAAIAGRTTVVSNDVAHDPRHLTALASTGSELVVPVVAGGRAVGTLEVEDGRTGAFSAADQVRFEALAAAMAPLVKVL